MQTVASRQSLHLQSSLQESNLVVNSVAVTCKPVSNAHARRLQLLLRGEDKRKQTFECIAAAVLASFTEYCNDSNLATLVTGSPHANMA